LTPQAGLGYGEVEEVQKRLRRRHGHSPGQGQPLAPAEAASCA
jgi:hypothetical protein